MIESLADSGRFTQPTMSAMESAHVVETYEAMDWLCYNKDLNNYKM